MDDIDRELLTLLQEDATRSYAYLAEQVGLSGGAVHERVRKLRERGVIRRTTITVDTAAIGAEVLSFVSLDTTRWMGDPRIAEALRAIPEIEEAHIVAGAGSVLVKVRTSSTRQLQAVLQRLFDIDGVAGTSTTVVLESVFERPTAIPPSA